MVNKSTTINQRQNPVISIVWTLIKPPHPLFMKHNSCPISAREIVQLLLSGKWLFSLFFPRGYLTTFYAGRLRTEVQHLTILLPFFSKNGTPFVYLPLINSTPFTYLVKNFASPLTAVNALSSNMNKSRSQKTFSTFSHQ